MCGVVGFVQRSDSSVTADARWLDEAISTLSHRGPDDGGTWIDSSAGVALGHRRLAIVDLSDAGCQPMKSASGRYVIVLNGEIYNHAQIREELTKARSGLVWRGHSDTETLLAAIESWGIESALQKSVGMFAFALWDRENRMLTLVRDRMGEKPLYYGWQGGCFLFGSELKALKAHPSFRADVDRDVLAGYLRRGYIQAPQSVYTGIFKLIPGTLVQISYGDGPGSLPRPKAFWTFKDVVEAGLTNPFSGSEAEATAELEAHISRAISLQRVADVPLGAFLSGGIDSSTIVALMQQQSARPVKTFTIGFHENAYDEARHARSVAAHLGTEHTEVYITPREAMGVIPSLPRLYDEPFGDSSAIPTYLVSKLARQQVKVSLSGDGGDELFAGYSRYQRTSRSWEMVRRVPHPLRASAAFGFRAFSNLALPSALGSKSRRWSHYLAADNVESFYDVQMSPRLDEYDIVLGSSRCSDERDMALANGCLFDAMMFTDGASYLPDDILVKVDRASMGASLECRVPLLDHRIVEFAWRIPQHMKVRGGVGKRPLRQVLRKYVPDLLVERPKMGFGVPVGSWVRGPLREWAEDLVSVDRLRRDGFLNVQLVRAQWAQYVAGKSVSDDSIWQLLMLQAWLADAGIGQNPAGVDVDAA